MVYRIPTAQRQADHRLTTLLWGLGTFIGALILSVFARSFILQTMVEFDKTFYRDMAAMGKFRGRWDWPSIVTAAVNFGLIGLILGLLQFPAAKKLKFNHWVLISSGSWMLGGMVFFVLSLIMDSFRPYELGVGNWMIALIAGAVVAFVQIKSLQLDNDAAFLWGLSVIVGIVFIHLVSGGRQFFWVTFNINTPYMLGWIPFVIGSTFAVRYIATEGLERSL